ncbi:MAG TPA: RNA 2',3'-cyclic phosphodiesterase [Nitrososphaeraceae archaeon]
MQRVFVAADIYKKKEIQKIQQNLVTYLKLDHKNLKLVRPENFHFTLVFFGEINNTILNKIVAKIAEIEFQSFQIIYDRIGVFPNSNNARVVWIGLNETTERSFNEMSITVTSKLRELDLKLYKERKKEIRPHITLFRTKKVYLNLNLNNIESKFIISDIIDTISVKKSTITNYGSIYENIISVKGK